MALLRSIRNGIQALRDNRARNREIEQELDSFLEESIQEKMRRGMSAEAALRAARVEMGSAETVRQKVWSAGWESTADAIWRDLTYTLRRLSRTPGLALVVLLSIALGIAANATVFSIVSKFLLRGVPVGNPATLITLYRTYDHGQCCNNLPYPVYQDLREQTKSFSGVSAYYELVPASITSHNDAQRVWGQATTENFFDVAQLPMTAGRGFLPNEYRSPVIVIGYRLWKQRFDGDPALIGKSVNVSGHSYTVVGVAPPGFRGLDQVLDPQFWVPLGVLQEITANSPHEESRTTQWLRIAARLKPGISQAQAQQELNVIAERLDQAHPETDKNTGFHIERAGALPARDKQTLVLFLVALAGVALLVLLIACANVANLLLAQGAQRQREMAVRLALGATRAQLLRHLLIESLVLALAGGVLGVLLSVWATYALSSFRLPVPVAIDLSVQIDWRVLLYSFALSLFAGFICGFLPAWTASRPVMPNALKGEEALARPGRRITLRNLLVVAQISLSLVLLCAAGLFLRSLEAAAKIDTGFRSRGIVMMAVDPQLHRYTPERSVQLLSVARQRIAALPGVLSASTTDGVPLSMGHRSDGFNVPGRPKPQGENVVELYMAGPDYFSTLGIPRVAGRDLGEENPTSTRVGVVNEEFVRRFFQGTNPVGHMVNGAGVPYQIVGVVKDTKSRTIGENQRPVLYRSINQTIASDPSQDGYTFMVRYEGDPSALITAMQHEIHAMDPSLAIFNVQTMQEHMRDALFLPRLVGTLFTVFGVSGLLLALIGLYSVMSYSVSQRTREIGVRMALGARAAQVQAMIVRGGMKLALVALLIGLPLALAAARLTTSLLYGIRPWDLATFTLIPTLLVAVSLFACWIPSRRASHVDPIATLRME
ncbi:MAG TPA: ABC transporter permease [Edaphobacter sp.]|jgi:predicted permease|nr:ABC transporter permease [Edaphobacter sp.]